MKQKQISIILGIHQSDISRLLSGARRVSYPLAEKLSDIFPWKSMKQWRNASPDEIREAFSHLRESE